MVYAFFKVKLSVFMIITVFLGFLPVLVMVTVAAAHVFAGFEKERHGYRMIEYKEGFVIFRGKLKL